MLAFPTIEDWLGHGVAEDVALVLLVGGRRSAADLKLDWQQALAVLDQAVPLVLLVDEEQPGSVLEAIADGVRGYIPLGVPLRVALEAIDLVRAGGIYLPADALARRGAGAGPPQFTGRQAAVANALRRGTLNKVIAHELGMAESTVKVHVRNIMRKLKACNRTHVAFLLNERERASG